MQPVAGILQHLLCLYQSFSLCSQHVQIYTNTKLLSADPKPCSKSIHPPNPRGGGRGAWIKSPSYPWALGEGQGLLWPVGCREDSCIAAVTGFPVAVVVTQHSHSLEELRGCLTWAWTQSVLERWCGKHNSYTVPKGSRSGVPGFGVLGYMGCPYVGEKLVRWGTGLSVSWNVVKSSSLFASDHVAFAFYFTAAM